MRCERIALPAELQPRASRTLLKVPRFVNGKLLGRGVHGKPQEERRPAAAVDGFDLPLVLLDDLGGDGKPQSGAGALLYP